MSDHSGEDRVSWLVTQMRLASEEVAEWSKWKREMYSDEIESDYVRHGRQGGEDPLEFQ